LIVINLWLKHRTLLVNILVLVI